MGQSMDTYNQFCLFCAAVHFLEGADLAIALFGEAAGRGPGSGPGR
jgi:hypothetical protein